MNPTIYEEAMIPVYEELEDTVKKEQGNFGLWYNKHISLVWNKKKQSWVLPEKAIQTYCEAYNKTQSNLKESLTNRHLQQYRFLSQSKGVTCVFQGTTSSRFVTGIGESHPNEISMVFDYTLGVPFISGSSIKGAVRMACLQNEVLNADGTLKPQYSNQTLEAVYAKSSFVELFGPWDPKDNGSRGNVVFLDAFPLEPPSLEADIINPHYNKYYQKTHFPTDDQSPVPIFFMTVKPGTTFVFRFLIKPGSEDPSQTLNRGLLTALKQNGLGAKTALGYGRFKVKPGEPETLDRREKKRMQEEKERLARIQDEQLQASDPVGFRLQKIREQTHSQERVNMINSVLADKTLPADFFSRLKELLQESGEWKLKSKKNKKGQERKRKIEERIQNG
ncbi:MAG: type III-B CRISPR module RAMP protein Cmr6 [Acidobacteria bacterium]|nr:MAG: type III-B CRISPR module RAMP protein Cmr6 [Acidobacteriota bacterium]